MLIGILSFQILVFFVTAVCLFVYLKLSHKFNWFDTPDEQRKLHTTVVPTSAGLIFMLPVIAFFAIGNITQPFDVRLIALLMLVLLLLGGLDDFKPMTAKLRLIILVILSGYFCWQVFLDSNIHYALLALYTIGLLWWLNLYNFMDGADGMAVLHALVTACGYGLAYFLLSTGFSIVLFYVLMFVLSLFAFLLFNFPKAKMFMGDAGSLSVAFCLAVFALYGIVNNVFGELLVVSFHLLFIIDATLTLVTRLYFKQKITQAHSLHLYQWLIHAGFSHAKVSLIYAFSTFLLVIITLYLHYIQADLVKKLTVLAVETTILTIIWFYYQNKTKFKQFE